MSTTEEKLLAVTGNQAVAMAMKQLDPDVVAAYPITPQTDVVQTFSEYVANGAVKAEFVTVESEHSAMSACIGAASAGARTMTATSSAGFALMWEVVNIAASMRLPIIMTTVNRAISGPINIHCDHSDSMGGRDTGWIQIYNEDAQEAYDATVMAFPIAEHADVRLPVMNMYDGFIISGRHRSAPGTGRRTGQGLHRRGADGHQPAGCVAPGHLRSLRRPARLVLRAQDRAEPRHGSGAAT